MGRSRYQEISVEAVPHQEDSRRRPQDPRRLQEGARHNFGEARQEGGEIHGQRPAVPVYEQGAVRAEHADADWDRVEYARRIPARNVAQGGHEDGDGHFSVGEAFVNRYRFVDALSFGFIEMSHIVSSINFQGFALNSYSCCDLRVPSRVFQLGSEEKADFAGAACRLIS